MRESHACATPEAARAEDVDAVEQRTRAYLSRHGLRVRPMEEREVAAVLTADRAIYNTSSPARLDTIQEWCAKVPDWGFVLEAMEQRNDTSGGTAAGGSSKAAATSSTSGSGGSSSSGGGSSSRDTTQGGWAPLGVCIMIPLSEAGWQALTSGALQEADMRDGGGTADRGRGACCGEASGGGCSAGCSCSGGAVPGHGARGSGARACRLVGTAAPGADYHYHDAAPPAASASPSPSSPSQALRPHPHTRLVHDPDAPGHGRMGLHIYHMERAPAYPPHLPTFGLVALYGIALGMCAAARRRQRAGQPGPLRLVGMSGLAVSPTGISLTSVLYGSREQGYISHEFVLRAPPPVRQPVLQQRPQQQEQEQQEQEPQRRRELTRAQAAVQGSGGGCCEQPGSSLGGSAGSSEVGDDGSSCFGLGHGGGGGGSLSGVLSGTAGLVKERRLEVHELRRQEDLDALLRAGTSSWRAAG
ncbi:hypothetical protein HXX76_016237 [Chlamydomonas incerta]|uniref:Uncharacterized protein n=1 Tax=Chlamydomonas incerta TaxID=51695 RepID=A0A835VQI9_CHLIN|nr:hypothetical protein HXX76_016237 [Chlamydomonas incerta]|eukprot:KAG2422158.1 hypothetical protein HXX76_016237 [Chlamydomonas incerta]